jgi:hypothetical protein
MASNDSGGFAMEIFAAFSIVSNIVRAACWVLKDSDPNEYVDFEGKSWDKMSQRQKDDYRLMVDNDPMGGWPPPRD